MVLTKLLKGTAGKFVAILSVLRHAKRSFERGRPIRGIALIALAVLAWKWAVVAFLAQGVVKLVRSTTDGEDGAAQAQ